MAVIRMGALLNNIKGKLGGQYFSSQNNNPCLRQVPRRSGKTNQALNTGSAVVFRSMANVSRAWSLMSEDSRNAWIAYAGTLTFYNKLNLPYTPSGYEVYAARSLKLAVAGQPPLEFPSLVVTEADVSKVAVFFSAPGVLKYRYHDTTPPSGTYLAIYASVACSAGVARPKGGYKLIFVTQSIAISNYDISADYIAVFGDLPVTGNFFIRVEIFSKESGIIQGVVYSNVTNP